MANDNPQIVDRSSLTGVFIADDFLPMGVEGHMSNDGDAALNRPERISSAEEAQTAFGVGSSLTNLITLILGRGIASVTAVASDPTHELTSRETAWEALEDDPAIRVRLSDGTTQADMVAHANSCEYAEAIQNKQMCFMAPQTPTSKATLSTLAAAIASKRAVLLGPGIYDLDGVLRGGADVSAIVAGEIAKNGDITDSLNLYEIPATAGIEMETATGLPLFRVRANGGSPVDDFQDLLDDGVSPLRQSPDGLAAFTHLRTTWTQDETFDALQTLLIKDEVFLGIRQELLNNNFLRKPNTLDNRTLAAAIVDAWLKAHSTWVSPIVLPNGTLGYGVSTTQGSDGKSFTISYFGNVVRGTNVIAINGTLTIAV